MEQHRTSQPQGRRRPQTPATPPVAPPGARVEGAAVYRVTGRDGRTPGRARVERAAGAAAAPAGRVAGRPAGRRPVPPVVLALRRLPSPRLTGLGAGLFASAVMLTLGLLDELLLDGSPVVYGLLFLPVSALTALWVRTADLVTAPIGVPIAFAVGVVPIAGGTGGFGGQAMAIVTALAVHAGWLYGGTLVAGLIASVRKVREIGRRHQRGAARTASGAGVGAGPGEGPGGRAPAAGRRPVV
ncbi:DUF6542 domain-containing protein [Streptomyces tanashiensis]|uniref:DUF6542 domain-containing protein n=1 Tax=Streptomyces tanashiensis TaxID=67367 RepID=A0ABY6QYY2_9ACTN|nr:DUF6542 domain-containing protein [Streptomyces tanashiensis]UZX21924.1 hypothetical protein LDH80_14885 [Streptomyces tanashiensis]